MRLSIVWTIFRKELVETLRDRRTLLMMVGLPVLVYPMILLGVSKLAAVQSEARAARASRVALWGELAPGAKATLERSGAVRLEPWTAAPADVRAALEAGQAVPPATPVPTPRGLSAVRPTPTPAAPEDAVLLAARAALADRALDAVLVAWPGFTQQVAQDAAGHLTIYWSSATEESQLAKERLDGEVAAFRSESLAQREERHELAPGFTRAVVTTTKNVVPPRRRFGQLLGSALPFLLIVMSLIGGFYPAVDLTAGEKERGTMQTLLCAPLLPVEIITGKFLAVWLIAVIAGLANIVSLAATLARIGAARDLVIPASSFFLTFLMLVPVTFIVSAIFVAVASFARDFKDGQNFLTPLFMVLALPTAVTLVPGVELSHWTAFVPVVNVALLIKAVLQGEAPGEPVFLTLLATGLYAMLSILLAARIFEREQILLGGRESVRSIFGLERRAGGRPTPSFVLVFFGLVLVVPFYGSLALEDVAPMRALLAIEYGFFLLPTLAAILLFGFSWRETLQLRLPSARGLLGAILLGISAWSVAAGVLVRLLPPPEELGRAMERILLLDQAERPLWQLWLLIALTPALCEELLFRGLILSGLRRLGRWPAILLCALLFGLAHSSIYRLLPTAFIGLACGLAVWQTGSILAGIVVHALSNGLMASMTRWPGFVEALGIGADGMLPWGPTLAGCGVMALGVALLVFREPPAERQGV